MPKKLRIPLSVRETRGIERVREPVSVGIPFPKAAIHDQSMLSLVQEDGIAIPSAPTVLDTWSDGSLRWVLFDFQISLKAHQSTSLILQNSRSQRSVVSLSPIAVEEDSAVFVVRTGEAEFCMARATLRPFRSVTINGSHILSEGDSNIIILDDNHVSWTPRIERSVIECSDNLKAVLYFEGLFSRPGTDHALRFRSRLYFYAGHSFVRIDFTLWNPKAAKHPEGLWDLGDQGSILFKDLSLNLALNSKETTEIQWNTQPTDPTNSINPSNPTNLLIYQDSSGGDNWNSRNHVNRHSEVPLSFKGYRMYESGQSIGEGFRATPVMALTDGHKAVVGALKYFWQNFPSAIETDSRCLRISPFPKYFNDYYELQGGEQKTHTMYFNFCNHGVSLQSLAWIYHPLLPQVPPTWYCDSGTIPHLIPEADIPEQFPYRECYQLIESTVKGDYTFFDRREIIDEYGWRNFGDLYADHEELLYEGEKPIISHYNNQYDLIDSFLKQYLRSGVNEWFTLAEQLAQHVIDIDIYHTEKDRYEYNNGLFWHTAHYTEAATSTHRSYPRQKDPGKTDSSTSFQRHPYSQAGGPSYSHVYSHGLLNYYLLTGDPQAKDAVIGLATYVSKGIDGPDSFSGLLKAVAKNTIHWLRDRVMSDRIVPYSLLDGPGRASGNALSVLLDGYQLTKVKEYLSKAEYLIPRCVHPKDDLPKRNLTDVNARLMYTIFLQSVGKYLDVKAELPELDYMYFYARDSLLHYAKWMLDNEVPFLSRPELIDYPNLATRAATDIRKANVLILAAKYSQGSLKKCYIEKAEFFFQNSVHDLLSSETAIWTRPLAIVMQNMDLPISSAIHPDEDAAQASVSYDFGSPYIPTSLGAILKKNINLLKKLLSTWGQN